MVPVRRIYVEKKPEFAVEARHLYEDLKENLGITGLTGLRIINRYDVAGISEEEYRLARDTIFSEPPVDVAYDEVLPLDPRERVFAIEYLPGQYDQRADSAGQCLQILTQKERPLVRSAKLIVLQGDITEEELAKIKDYCINPVEAREAALDKPVSLELEMAEPPEVAVIQGFIDMKEPELAELHARLGLAMGLEDLAFCQTYFRDTEGRNPTITELRVLDTYWSDHCRHTTFLTRINEVEIEAAPLTEPVKEAYQEYLRARTLVYGEEERDICLMDIAVMGMKELRQLGKLPDLDESEEINACSIIVPVEIDGRTEEWLLMFKNETHNHPTEIEPFGGAATCLGGAIRDPLSGRSYVYQAMRVTGSGDPRARVEDTLPGKLPQRKITTGAAAGYSSYGNQIGLATGQVAEIYDQGYIAKRMEIGAVIGAAPRTNVVRQRPQPGDVIILLGGRTGRDGCGGATGSSKEHTEESLFSCGAEVQKGNPPEERKIQRLFRKPEVSCLIKKCNDFGAGGVSVAIGELADGLDINLDAIPKKYEGLDGTELAISESQERMAVVVAAADVEQFIQLAAEENLEATPVARVTAERRLRMHWRGQTIVDISRDFLNTNGVKQTTQVTVIAPKAEENYFAAVPAAVAKAGDLQQAWLANLQDLNVCSQKGLVERFDSTIGAGTVLMPLGGIYQDTPAEGMAAKIPVLEGETVTGTLMTFGYNPQLAKWSPFHGALYAVVEAVTKIVAMGGDYRRVRLTLQEYFEKLGKDRQKWGKPFSALLGAYLAQKRLGIAAIGGKDSMSGTFKDLNVPPTLVAFAVAPVDVRQVISPEFKQAGSRVVLVRARRDEREIPDFQQLQQNFSRIHELISQGRVLAAHSVRLGGLAAVISKMAFGNRIGFAFANIFDGKELFAPLYGSLVLEVEAGLDLERVLAGLDWQLLGQTLAEKVIRVNGIEIDLEEAYRAWTEPLEGVFPTRVKTQEEPPKIFSYWQEQRRQSTVKIARPRILMPVFPGTNCEYDTARAFTAAGGIVETLVIRNLTPAAIEESLAALVAGIKRAQIIMLPGGFSGGDEPDGSGKFIATAFRNPRVRDAVMELLYQRDGLMLGICNGFQALIKLGLVPFGEIRDLSDDSPTLTFNTLGRHVSKLVRTRVASNLSPWLSLVEVGDIHTVAVSHGEGRFVAAPELVAELARRGQIATQYVDLEGKPTYDLQFNPNGSIEAIEGITSPDGRVLGKMGHSERIGPHLYRNVPGEFDQKIFAAGVAYFR
ncbi:phosphoribosylformylglycinamidine synthase [Carboxydocella sporoproducens DSM 16521]|uniref:Phosphoribosylformylglycinamidine synthase n=2 Tax=Carboxydocella TaxID=178898 RepID=A0A1T4Q9K3_9FIRM|nr:MULTISPECIES: phosphoribosylformylglycinamidine synthase [Carboxydocella]AVX19355.1 phosphoribosylformylglycinamidine synthase [Carboxydocella thermautotrophica]SKA00480.1 phosphoribosylformylglycinamidine synthase [Carboxydocella sporoproducens DSM 16521]